VVDRIFGRTAGSAAVVQQRFGAHRPDRRVDPTIAARSGEAVVERDLDLRLVRSFVALASELHFGRAASRLFVAQQTLSADIARLEALVGVPLFVRTSRHVELTAAGRRIQERAGQLLFQAGLLVREARGEPQPLRVAATNDAVDILPRILERLLVLQPAGEIECGLVPGPGQIRRVYDRRLDVAVVGLLRQPPGLRAELLRLDSALVVVGPDHPLAVGDGPVQLRRLAEHPVHLPPATDAPEVIAFVRALEARTGVHLTPTRSRSMASGPWTALVRSGGVGLAFSSVTLPPGDWVTRPLTEPTPLFPWWLLWHADDESERTRWFLTAARQAREKLAWLRPATAGQPWLPDGVAAWLWGIQTAPEG
jgi:DNA-binding transcriptional LysR family regulator